MINILLDFVKNAGDYLIQQQKTIKPLLNKDSSVCSVVTQADLHVSDLFEKTLQENFSDLNYMIIDEEKITKYGDNIFDEINKSEYQFIIDPIDGTIQYANGHHLFGITVGVYKNTKPLMGIIYMPKLNELLYFDGHKAYRVENPFTKSEIKTELLPQTQSYSPIAFANQFIWNINNDLSVSNTAFFNYFSAVSQCFYTLIGKSRALCMKTRLWDIAGTIPLANYLGIKIFEYDSKKIYDSISPEYFNTDMGTKNPCIMCYPDNYDEIAKLVTPK